MTSLLSREQLRLKRLQALGVASNNNVVDLTRSDGESDDPSANNTVRPTSPDNNKKRSAVQLPSRHVKRPALQQAAVSNKPLCVSLVTWNVWFGPPQGPNPHVAARMQALVKQLLSPHHNILAVGLQEVTPSARVVLIPALQQQGLNQIVSQSNQASYGCLLAIRGHGVAVQESGWNDFSNTAMGRGYCYARIEVENNQQLLIATTHLESYNDKSYAGSMQRQQQVLEFQRYCQQQFVFHHDLHAAVLMGDLNWDDERKTNAPDPPLTELVNAVDVWKQSNKNNNSKSTCYTYDGKLNPMLSNNLRRRFDRCLLWTHPDRGAVQCLSTQLLGQEALPGLTFSKINPFQDTTREMPVAISDHFGFQANIRLEPIDMICNDAATR